jgi:meiotic recombination protein REC8, fungi type
MRRRHRPTRVIAPDTMLELHNRDLARWQADYVANMHEIMKHKQVAKLAAIAKENAKHWILGPGTLGKLGQSDRLVSGPLDMFSGAKLLEALTGVKLAGGKKRSREDDVDDQSQRRVRSRGLDPSSDEYGRGGYDDGYMPAFGDDNMGIEQGRDAPTPLDDQHPSSVFPWNQSSSRRPTGNMGSATMPGGTGQQGMLSRRASRLATASPLVRRGMTGGGSAAIQDFQLGSGAIGDDLGMAGIDDFELYGPAAQVDTQTAEQSQWQRTALDGESRNFLEFVEAKIEEIDQAHDEAGDEALKGSIDFDVLLPPQSNTRIVAAQAMLHVLALGTKNKLKVAQEEAFGPISLLTVDVF